MNTFTQIILPLIIAYKTEPVTGSLWGSHPEIGTFSNSTESDVKCNNLFRNADVATSSIKAT